MSTNSGAVHSEALDHDYYIWVKNGNLRKLEIKMPDRHEGS